MDAIRINKHDSKVLKWLQSAASDDKSDQPSILTGVNSNGSHTACDGFRLHSVQSFDSLTLPDGTRDYGKVPASGLMELPAELDGDFPTYNNVMPSGEPVFEIALNPRLLIDALKVFIKSNPEMVILRFHGDSKPFEVFGNIDASDDSTPGYALIMPMHLGESVRTWRP